MKQKQTFLGFFLEKLQSRSPARKADEKNNIRTKGVSISYAYVQEGAIYNIGDDPRSYIRDGYRKNPNVYAVIEMIA
ncbi:MAG TPA: hypothetical protein VK783_08185, partial [Bacteroidia bacterium]|nr:hypothetical protein [Bacteroidia bacterium]